MPEERQSEIKSLRSPLGAEVNKRQMTAKGSTDFTLNESAFISTLKSSLINASLAPRIDMVIFIVSRNFHPIAITTGFYLKINIKLSM